MQLFLQKNALRTAHFNHVTAGMLLFFPDNLSYKIHNVAVVLKITMHQQNGNPMDESPCTQC
ncbi:MAG: hypothetical protein LKF96_06850 [Treponema sp.]|nr:hypothetical protein [Treponema sp.]